MSCCLLRVPSVCGSAGAFSCCMCVAATMTQPVSHSHQSERQLRRNRTSLPGGRQLGEIKDEKYSPAYRLAPVTYQKYRFAPCVLCLHVNNGHRGQGELSAVFKAPRSRAKEPQGDAPREFHQMLNCCTGRSGLQRISSPPLSQSYSRAALLLDGAVHRATARTAPHKARPKAAAK